MEQEAILRSLPEDMPEEDRAMIAAALPLVDADALVALLADAGAAQLALASGDRAGAVAIVERHRALAASAGMEPMLDAIIAGL